MTEDRARILVVSAKESVLVAEATQRYFEKHGYEVVVWNQIFSLGVDYLKTLLNNAAYYDYAIAIFSADDQLVMRDKQSPIPRANVIFEFGLFLGRLNLARTFFLREESVTMFSDWGGVAHPTFRRDQLEESVGRAGDAILTAIGESHHHLNYNLAGVTALAHAYVDHLTRLLRATGYSKRVFEKVVTVSEQPPTSPGENRKKIDWLPRTLKNPLPTVEVRVPASLSELTGQSMGSRFPPYRQVLVESATQTFSLYSEEAVDEPNGFALFDVPTCLLGASKIVSESLSRDFLRDNRLAKQQLERSVIQTFTRVVAQSAPQRVTIRSPSPY